MQIKLLTQIVLSISLLLLSGCADSSSPSKEVLSITKLESNATRDLTPDVSEVELLTLAENNNKFAFTIFSELRKSSASNVSFSPYSISEAFAIACSGANGDTKTEIASVFNFDPEDDVKLHKGFNALSLDLNYEDDIYTFESNNAIWIQRDYSILPSYLDAIQINYGANVKTLDFINKSESSRVTINEYVQEKTHGRVEEILPDGMITEDTRVVLTNTVYFKGTWSTQFDRYDTKDDTFTKENGSTQQVPFMLRHDASFKYLRQDNYQAIELPYVGDKSSMLIILPDEGGVFKHSGKYREYISKY